MKLLAFSFVLTLLTDLGICVDNYIINGKDAEDGQFPYQVELFCSIFNYCGGTLISPTFVLTAAHCLNVNLFGFHIPIPANLIDIYLGNINFAQGIKRIGRKKIIHPDWVGAGRILTTTTHNDIALLKIDEVPFSDCIRSIALPEISEPYPDFEEEVVISSGWGKTNKTDSDIPRTLQYTELEVISNDECSKFFKLNFLLKDVICAKSNKKSTVCSGDSGGPLVLRSKLASVLIGISSFGEVICSGDLPVGFTRITYHREWIRYHTGL